MFHPANPHTRTRYRGSLPPVESKAQLGHLAGHTVRDLRGAPSPLAIPFILPGAVSAAGPKPVAPQPANQWARPTAPAPHQGGQSRIGQRPQLQQPQPAPQPQPPPQAAPIATPTPKEIALAAITPPAV